MPVENILTSTMFFAITTLGIGWLAIDLVSKRRPTFTQNWLSIIIAGLIISNVSIQAAWLITDNWMGFETFGTGVREIFLLNQNRDIILVAVFTSCCLLLVASLIKRLLVFRRTKAVRRKRYSGDLRTLSSAYSISGLGSLEDADHDE
jgi:hypothetical protein